MEAHTLKNLQMIFFISTHYFDIYTFLYFSGLRLPDSDQLQLLKINHPLELYDTKFRNILLYLFYKMLLV